jgi:hypothetical protein
MPGRRQAPSAFDLLLVVLLFLAGLFGAIAAVGMTVGFLVSFVRHVAKLF